MKYPVIALIADFDTHDVYVGVMKGVMLSINPGAIVAGVAQSIPGYDVVADSYAPSASCRFFPGGSAALTESGGA